MATSSLDWKPIIDINNDRSLGVLIKSGDGKLFTDALTTALYKTYKDKQYSVHLKKRELRWVADMLRTGAVNGEYPYNRADRRLYMCASQRISGGIEIHLTQINRFEQDKTRAQSLILTAEELPQMYSFAETACRIMFFDPAIMNGLSANNMSIIFYKAWNNKVAKLDFIPYEEDHFLTTFIHLRCKIDPLLSVILPDMPHVANEFSATLNMAIPAENKVEEYGSAAEAAFGSLMEQLISFVV